MSGQCPRHDLRSAEIFGFLKNVYSYFFNRPYMYHFKQSIFGLNICQRNMSAEGLKLFPCLIVAPLWLTKFMSVLNPMVHLGGVWDPLAEMILCMY